MPASAWQGAAKKIDPGSTPTALIRRFDAHAKAHAIKLTLWLIPRRKLWYVWAEERSRFDSFLLRVPPRGVVMNEPRLRRAKNIRSSFSSTLSKAKEVTSTCMYVCVNIQIKVILHFRKRHATRHACIYELHGPTTFLLHISHDQRNEAKALECGRRYKALAGYGRRPRIGGLVQ